MLDYILYYLILLFIILIFDFVWIGLIAKKFYNTFLGYAFTDKPKWKAAVVFYLIYTFGLLFFVVNPALVKEDSLYPIYAGLLFGLACFSTYDLTNLATLKNWPVNITVIDIIWGSLLSSVASYISYEIITYWFII